jgi:thiol-disulfide isomerase/thioredoxin
LRIGWAGLGLCWLVLAECPWPAAAATPAAERPPDVFERFGVAEFAEGQRAPAFALKDLAGRTVTLEQFQGKLVLMNFWATWCEPCEWEMPSMEAFARRYRGKPVVLLAVSVDTGAADIIVRPYVQGKGFTFPVLLDSTLRTSRAYRVRGLPTTFFVGPDGQFIGQAHGPRDWTTSQATALVDHLLARGR